jgi:hypothetical protein
VLIAAPLFHMNGLFSAKLVMLNGGTSVDDRLHRARLRASTSRWR